MKLPSAYLGLGQGLFLHPQLGEAVHTERCTTATLFVTTMFQYIKHILVAHGRKGMVGTVKKTGEVGHLHQIESTSWQCMQHVLQVQGRKWRAGTVGRA